MFPSGCQMTRQILFCRSSNFISLKNIKGLSYPRHILSTAVTPLMADAFQSEKTALQLKQEEEFTSRELFESQKEKNKDNFKKAIDIFHRRNTRNRGQVEFIRAALKNMETFDVHRDIEVYRALIDIMPKGKYVPENRFQADFKHFPKHQDCIVDVLSQMEDNQVCPDEELGNMIENIFSMKSGPYRKFMRMMYWMHKFKNTDPWPKPFYLPDEDKELARLAIKQITSTDRLTKVSEYDCNDLEESNDKTWIISGQSPEQKEMISNLPQNEALYVEGAFRVWMRKVQVNYFILRGQPVPRPPPSTKNINDFSTLKNWALGQADPSDLVRIPNKHEQEDGSLFACCATGTSSKDSLLSWIRFLQRENPALENIPILFTFKSPVGPVEPVDTEGAMLRRRSN